jgi:hypothetical protein
MKFSMYGSFSSCIILASESTSSYITSCIVFFLLWAVIANSVANINSGRKINDGNSAIDITVTVEIWILYSFRVPF